MKIVVKSEEELIRLAANAIHILNNLRRTTKEWKEYYGSYTRNRMVHYEERADELISSLNVQHVTRLHDISIHIQSDSEK